MSTAALWRTLRTSWRWLLAGAGAGLLVAGFLLLVLPKTYVAQSTLLVSASATDPAAPGTETLEFAQSRLPNYVAIANADASIAAIAKATGVEASDVDRHLSYEVEPETTVIAISAEGDNPQIAQRTAKAAAASLSGQITSTSTPAMTMSATVLEAARAGELASPKPSIILPSGAIAGLVLALIIVLVRAIRHTAGTEQG